MDFTERFAKENPAFQTFLEYAKMHDAFNVSVKGKSIEATGGAILIWSAVTQGLPAIARQSGLNRVLSIEKMLHQLAEWNCESWRECVAQYRTWSEDLFGQLVHGMK